MYYSLDTAGYHSHLIGHIYACACGTRVNTKPTDLWYAPISNEYNILCMIEVSDIVQSSQEYGNAWKKMTWWDTLSISICYSISLTHFHRLLLTQREYEWEIDMPTHADKALATLPLLLVDCWGI